MRLIDADALKEIWSTMPERLQENPYGELGLAICGHLYNDMMKNLESMPTIELASMKTTNEISCCPLCGAGAKGSIYLTNGTENLTFKIECSECGLILRESLRIANTGLLPLAAHIDAFIQKWNRRE